METVSFNWNRSLEKGEIWYSKNNVHDTEKVYSSMNISDPTEIDQ
jgi:hypothetical protein